jgi:hypothetical protein
MISRTGDKFEPNVVSYGSGGATTHNSLHPLFLNAQEEHYLDPHSLIKGSVKHSRIKPEHWQWFLNQAVLLSKSDRTDKATQRTLDLLTLHAYSKVSTIGEQDTKVLGVQGSPIFSEECGYHRVTRNPLLTAVDEAFSKEMGLKPWEAQLICSPLVREVLKREYPQPELDLAVESTKKYELLIEGLLKDAKKGRYPKHRILVDLSDLLKANNTNPKEIPKLVHELEIIFLAKLHYIFPEFSAKAEVADKLISKLHLLIFTEHKTADQVHHILVIPNFLVDPGEKFGEESNKLLQRGLVCNRQGFFARELSPLISRTGYRISPDKAKAAWLSICNISSILKEIGLPEVKLAGKGSVIPKVCTSFRDFLNQPVVSKFRNLGNGPDVAPYLKVLPEVTVRLLEGLANYDIQKIFEGKGIGDLLQISYFRMMNAMGEAINRKRSLILFNNQLEVLHQEIQTILSIVSPYGEKDFAHSIKRKMTKDHIIPSSLGVAGIHLKPSGMHSLSSVLASVEALKDTNHLNVALLDGCYYHENNTLECIKTYDVSSFDSKKLSQYGVKAAFELPPAKKLDVLITEFHHNILQKEQEYRPENVLLQVKSLIEGGLVSDQFTVVIDNTIDVEKSEDAKQFLADPLIQEKIQAGKLNVVFLRSAQKFDMLSMDNYYGGISITINVEPGFSKFNLRMNHKDDQLEGINYQGLTHVHKYSDGFLDKFRKAIMGNTRKLYLSLPRAAIFQEGSKNPLQISKLVDDRLFFLDIKFPNYPRSASAFNRALVNFAREKNLPFAARASFGFIHTTMTLIDGKKLRLNVGMEGDEVLNLYASFIGKVQSIIENVLLKEDPSIQTSDMDIIIADRIKQFAK